MSTVTKRGLVAALAGGLMIVGVAAPAFAMPEGTRTSYMRNWIDSDASSNWSDPGKGTDRTRVTFYDCTREFKATIRKTVPLAPDPNVGSEWIDCKSYADAVYAGVGQRANYHFDVTGMGFAYCTGTNCVYNKTSVNKLRIYW